MRFLKDAHESLVNKASSTNKLHRQETADHVLFSYLITLIPEWVFSDTRSKAIIHIIHICSLKRF